MGWADRRVAGWAAPEPSLRHVRQAWPPGGHAFPESGPADMGGGGGGGGPAKFWSGRGETLWRRDLSALGPFGAEANC